MSFRPWRRARSASAVVAATAVLTLATAGLAFADDVDVDGDTVKTNNNVQYAATANTANRACSERGTAVNGVIDIDYSEGGAAPKHYAAGESLTVTITNPTAGITVVPPASPSIPAGWGGAVNTVTLGITTTVATSVPNGTYSVGVSVKGATSNVTRTDSYNVSITGCTITASNTAPTVTVTGVTDGGSYDKGSVPAAVCQVADTQDGPSSFAATLSAITGPYASDGIGSQTASCSYTDAGGLTDTDSATYSIGDPTAPTISYTLTPTSPDGDNDWYTSDVTLTWIVSDPQSPNSLVKTGCADQSITADQTSVTYTCSATSAGGSAGPVSVTIKRDAGLPTITHELSGGTMNANGWYKDDVTVTFTCGDATSGIASCSSPTTLGEGANQSVTGTAKDNAGNTQTDTASGINIDKTGPTISHATNPVAPNAHGWFKDDVTVTFTCEDALSGIASCLADGEAGNTKVLGEGENQSVGGTATDVAGNVSTDTAADIDVDKTVPTVGLVGGPADGGTYYFGFVPGAPSCSASDALSGLDGSCSVGGYSNAVGTHTVTATVTDKAGNESTATATYTVSAWTLNGFFQPVDMGGVWNTIKGGSTVPLKFRIFAGPTELKDVAYVKSFSAKAVSCDSGAAAEDAIEQFATTGGTSLRYDTTGGQFIQNWKVPTTKGCYAATMTAQDGGTITALFKVK